MAAWSRSHQAPGPSFPATSTRRPTSSSSTPASALGLTVQVTTAGQTLRVRAKLTPAPVGPVDAFVVFRVENLGVFSLQFGGVLIPALVPIAVGFVPNVPLEAEIFPFPLTGNEPPGTHAVLSALTQTGTLNVIGEIDEKVFTLP
jgi:hypothetical protein